MLKKRLAVKPSHVEINNSEILWKSPEGKGWTGKEKTGIARRLNQFDESQTLIRIGVFIYVFYSI